MSIRAVCKCGKGFQVLNSRPGKKFECTFCGSVVTVPDEQFDELEEVAEDGVVTVDEDSLDELFEERPKAPVVRPKRKSRKKNTSGKYWRKVGLDVPRALLQFSGLIAGMFGMCVGWIYIILGALRLGRLDVASALILWVLGSTTILGARACRGKGLQVSRGDPWMGDGSIIVGFFIMWFGIIVGAICVVLIVLINMRGPMPMPPGNRALRPGQPMIQPRQPAQPAPRQKPVAF